MSYKSILVLALGRHDDQAIQAGAWLAAEHGGAVRVLPVFPDIAADLAVAAAPLGGMIPPGAYEAAAEITADNQDRTEAACRVAAAASDVAMGPGQGAPRLMLLAYDRRSSSALEREAVLADLVVISGDAVADRSDRTHALIEDILMRLRRPLLIARGPADSLRGRAIVAWNGRQEAGRAVEAALPLLGGVSRTLAATHGDLADRPDLGSLGDYLDLHDMGRPESLTLTGDDAGAALLDACRSHGVGLLVAGAYGHSRLRQMVMGGVTRTLLDAADGPSLLLTH